MRESAARHVRVPRILTRALVLLLAALTAPLAQTVRSIPDVSLEVAVRQSEDGKLSEGFQVAQLDCYEQRCRLQWLLFSACEALGSKKPTAIFKTEEYSTVDGTLKVLPTEKGLEVSTEIHQFGRAKTTLYFGLKKSDINPSRLELASFSGGFVKNSTVLNKVITAQYVPMKGTYVPVEVGCPILFHGVP